MTKRHVEVCLDALVEQVVLEGPQVVKSLGIQLHLDEAEELSRMLQARHIEVRPFDFPGTKNVWKGSDRPGLSYAQLATKTLVQRVAQEQKVDYTTFAGFKAVLPFLTSESFMHTPINKWGTTLLGQMNRAYGASCIDAILDLVTHDNEFKHVRDLRSYDFPKAPVKAWRHEGKPTDLARKATTQFIYQLGKIKNVDVRTLEGFKTILPELTAVNFRTLPINRWETNLCGTLHSAYHNSPSDAVLDMIAHNPDFANFRDLQAYDFPKAAANTWQKKGKPTLIAREATKTLVMVLGKENGVNPKMVSGFKKILPVLTEESFFRKPINRWGTTLAGMLTCAYGGNVEAIMDLVTNDKEFATVKPFVTPTLFNGTSANRQSRWEGKYDAFVIHQHLGAQGIDLSPLGYYAFKNGEKQEIRDIFAEQAHSFLKDKRISYFGLEGPTFGSYFALAQKLNIDSRTSLVPERDERAYNVMSRIKSLRKVNSLLKESRLSRLELVLSSAEEALQKTNKQFDLVFLDWLGHLSPSGLRELELAYAHLKQPGMIGVTLNVSPLSEKRYTHMLKTEQAQEQHMQSWAKEHSMKIESIDYKGGDTRNVPMQLYIMKR